MNNFLAAALCNCYDVCKLPSRYLLPRPLCLQPEENPLAVWVPAKVMVDGLVDDMVDDIMDNMVDDIVDDMVDDTLLPDDDDW